MPESSRTDRLRIVVLGYVVRAGMGGMAWHYLHYVLGLSLLGHDVHYIEDSGDDTWCCYDAERDVTDSDASYGLAFMGRCAERLGIGERWAYYDAHGGGWAGPNADHAVSTCRDADVVVNVSGANVLRGWFDGVDRKVLVDTDPAFTQVRNLVDPAFRERTEMHDVFVTFGESIGLDDCRIPDDGFDWRPTRQPVVLDAWPHGPPPAGAAFTTVMQWRTKNAQTYSGTRYGTKEDSFAPFRDLPGSVDQTLELALGGKDAPRDRLRASGWRIRDPRGVAADPWRYQRYLLGSRAELSIAKHGYVASGSGWFSERSACYLAAGRPVVAHDTGFGAHLPTGCGLLAFGSPEEAAESIRSVDSDYDRHSTAARAIAAERFAHERVLGELLDHVS